MVSSPGPSLIKCVLPYWTRDKSRSRRKRVMRSRTLNIKRLPKRELLAMAELVEVEMHRPKTRGECTGVPRPCPFVSCKHHLYLDVHERTGNLKFNFPDLEPGEMKDSCALDVADEGGRTMERVGDAMNIVRERIRQVEEEVAEKVKRRLPMLAEELWE